MSLMIQEWCDVSLMMRWDLSEWYFGRVMVVFVDCE
jgi:hypothetical protein